MYVGLGGDIYLHLYMMIPVFGYLWPFDICIDGYLDTIHN